MAGMVTGPSGSGVVVGRLPLPDSIAGQATRSVRCRAFSKVLSTPVRRRELPSAYLTMIVGLGDPLVLVGAQEGHNRSVGSFVSGLQHRCAITERNRHQYGVHIELPAIL